MYKSFPGRQTSNHYCLSSDTRMVALMRAALSLMELEAKLRVQIHVGNHVECQYRLMSYGIPVTLFLFDQDGNIRQDFVNIWIERQRRREEKESLRSTSCDDDLNVHSSSITSNPGCMNSQNENQTSDSDTFVDFATDKDVLLGRGVPIQSHPGNIRLAKIIEDRWDTYNQSRKKVKKDISLEIVNLIVNEGGRFLERDDAGWDAGRWKVCSLEHARYKVTYGFRTVNKMQKQKQLKQPQKQRRPRDDAGLQDKPIDVCNDRSHPKDSKRPKTA